MDDALLMGSAKGVSDLTSDGQRFNHRHRAVREPIGQGLAIHQFENQRQHAIGILEPVDRADVRMIE